MTVRDATQRESPDGNVLYIGELREHLGLKTTTETSSSPTRETASRPEVLLVGHDMHGDFQSLENEDIDLGTHLLYSGCVDTHVVVEDADAPMGKSLSKLMYHYDLAELEFINPGCPRVPGKWHFKGAHNAGNDAVATLKVILAQALDRRLTNYTYKAHSALTSQQQNIYNPLLLDTEPPRNPNTNMILLAYDHEGVENPRYKPQVRNRTSEHGFAWLNLKDVISIPPGKNGVNWHPFIRARHFINNAFRNVENRWYVPGNRDGFWGEFGQSKYYTAGQSPRVFHDLFEEIAREGRGDGPDAVPALPRVGEARSDGVDDISTLPRAPAR